MVASATIPMMGPHLAEVTTTAADPVVSIGGRLLDRLGAVRAWLAATGGHGAWIGLWSIVGWSGTILAPFLIDRPFLLMMLAPRALFVVLAVDSVDLVSFVLAGTLRLGMTDASYFILGRRFPRDRRGAIPRPLARVRLRFAHIAVRWTDALCRWLCNHGAKAGTVLFFRPNGKYLAVAGSYGVSARVAGWCSVIGTALYLTFFYLGLGLFF